MKQLRISRLFGACLFLAATLSTWASPEAPETVSGLCRAGLGTRTIKVAVKDSTGHVPADAQPGIVLLRSARWSPNDASRDGASELEVLISVAKLLETHALAGVVAVGNQHGTFVASAEQALSRAALMGLPVVKLAPDRALGANPENLYIEAGAISPERAEELLSACLLQFGTLAPAKNPVHPTDRELAAIQQKLTRYQLVFDAEAAATHVALR